MTGWRARIGLLVPSSNTAAEVEFPSAVPTGVATHVARLSLESVTADALDTMGEEVSRAGELLAHADVDAVAYACTTGSLLHGPGYDADLEDELSTSADAPAVATALSVDRALSALAVDRVAVATPYVDDLNEREREYLEAAGFELGAIEGRGIEANREIGALDHRDAYRQARSIAADGSADGIFISCTNYRTLGAIEPLEDDLGVPVITSNQATLWDVCRVANVAVNGPGRLFDVDLESSDWDG